MTEPRYGAWHVLALTTLILALVAATCLTGLALGFSLGRLTARPMAPYSATIPEFPPAQGPDGPALPPGHARLGVRYVNLTPELARQEGLPVEAGALVRQVDLGGPADAAGVQRGDVITEVDGLALGSRRDLRELMVEYAPGDVIELTILRGERTLALTVTLGVVGGTD